MARGVLSHLTNLTQSIEWGEKREKIEREKEKDREKRGILERNSTFSLDFPVSHPSNFGKTRGKVTPHCKSYAWVPILCCFDKLRNVGFSHT